MPSALKLILIFTFAAGLSVALAWPAALLLQADVKVRAGERLDALRQPGLAVSVDGRSALLSGHARSPQALLAAREALAGLAGVRVLLVSASVESPVFQPHPVDVAPLEPVAVRYLARDEPTRPEPSGKSLAVSVPERQRVLVKPAGVSRQCIEVAVVKRGRPDVAGDVAACRFQGFRSVRE